MRVILIAFITLLLLLNHAESRRRKSHSSSNDDESNEIQSGETTSNKSPDEKDIDTIKYDNKEDLNRKIKKLQNAKKKSYSKEGDEEIDEIDRSKYLIEEQKLRVLLDKAVAQHGDLSSQKSEILHKLGRVIYKLKKMDEALEISKEIVRINEEIYGVEHIKTADALGNVGSVSFRLKLQDLCELVMYRALHIIIKKYGVDAKETLLHRAKMLTYQIKDGETSKGLDYETASELYSHVEL